MSARTIRLLLERFVDEDHPNAPANLSEMVRVGLATLSTIIHENNALRRNNERLTARVRELEKEREAARQEVRNTDAANRAAQTMAAHWRIQAKGGDYDATQEDES